MGNWGSRDRVELGREEAATLARDTGFTEEGVRDWHRAFLKDHPTGHISRAKFVTMYRNFFTKGDADQFSKNVFRVFDTDGSGTIEFGEFLTATHATSSARVVTGMPSGNVLPARSAACRSHCSGISQIYGQYVPL